MLLVLTSVENRHKHQGNEYKQELGLNWMDFNFRQYDPQIGRFLSVDPLADYYGQDRYSPYAAMGNQPESMVDPNGLAARDGITPEYNHGLGIGSLEGSFTDAGGIPTAGDFRRIEGGLEMMIMGGALDFYNSLGVMSSEMMGLYTIAKLRQFSHSQSGNLGGGSPNVGDVGVEGDGTDGDRDLKFDLRQTPNGERTVSVEEWAEHYKGWSWQQIVTEYKGKHGDGYQRIGTDFGLSIKVPYGPNLNWRFVKLDDGIILDMRHVLVVGMEYGEKIGFIYEYFQGDEKSRMSLMDMNSNRVGEKFLNYLEENSIYYDSRNSTTEFGKMYETRISTYFLKFIQNSYHDK